MFGWVVAVSGMGAERHRRCAIHRPTCACTRCGSAAIRRGAGMPSQKIGGRRMLSCSLRGRRDAAVPLDLAMDGGGGPSQPLHSLPAAQALAEPCLIAFLPALSSLVQDLSFRFLRAVPEPFLPAVQCQILLGCLLKTAGSRAGNEGLWFLLLHCLHQIPIKSCMEPILCWHVPVSIQSDSRRRFRNAWRLSISSFAHTAYPHR